MNDDAVVAAMSNLRSTSGANGEYLVFLLNKRVLNITYLSPLSSIIYSSLTDLGTLERKNKKIIM